MSDRDLHLEDHKAIMSQMDVSKDVAEVKMECVLLKERLREMKEDKDKAEAKNARYLGWLLGIVLTVAGSAINSYSTINVLQEKVMELKKEMEQVAGYAHEHE